VQLSVMRTKLRTRIGNPSITDVPDANLTTHLNDSYREIANKFKFHLVRSRYDFSTVIGTRLYNLPTGSVAILKAQNLTALNEGRIEKLDDRRRAETTITGVTGPPTGYIRYQNQIELDPTPDAVYSIRLILKSGITDLSLDADTPVLPVSWHEGIIKLAKYNYYANEQNDLPKATFAKQDFKDWLVDQPTEIDEEKVDFDSGVSLPELNAWAANRQRLDFDHSP